MVFTRRDVNIPARCLLCIQCNCRTADAGCALSGGYMKKIIMLCVALLCCTGMYLFAQDSFFDDIDVAESTSTNEGTSFGSSGSGSGNSGTIDFSGFANLGIRMYPHKDLKRTEALPVFGINFKYSGARTELDSHFKCNALTIADYPLDLIDEFTVRAYLGDFVLSTGKMKLVWGRGDMIHVLDVFNANDFTDFTIPAYIDRRIAEPMVHLAYNAPIPLRLEAAWTPLMTPDRFSLKGAWVPPQITEIKRNAKASLNEAISNPRISQTFNESALQKALHAPISKELKNITSRVPTSITIDMKDIVAKLDEAALLNGINPLVKGMVKKLLTNLAKQKITVSITEIANKILPPKPDGSPYTEAEIKTLLAGEPFLTEVTTRIAKEIAGTAQKAETELVSSLKKAGAIIENFQFDECAKIGMNAFMPDMHQIKYGQYGLRLSGSAGHIDMACQYYYGHYKTPSINVEKMITYAMEGKNIRECVYYDPVHIFGADLGAAIAMFNFKSEAAYYMTEDFKGTDPAVHNNSLQWVLGFDVDIPLNNLNLNVQNIGSHIIGFKNVRQNNKSGKMDMDWNTAEKSTNNKLVFNVSDSWLHETLTDSVTVIWGIEHNDVVVMPKIKYKIKDEFYIEGAGAYIYAKDKKSEFASWKNNHFAQVSFEYKF